MFGSATFLILSLCAEPVAASLAPTCVRPVPHVVAASSHCAATVAKMTDCREIVALLHRWERTVGRIPEPSRAQRDRLRHEVSSAVNGHAAIASKSLVGRIDVNRLMNAFDWTITERREGRVCLQAVPRDETEQLFYRSLSVWLDPQTGSPERLAVCDRQGGMREAWQFHSTMPSIQLVSLIEDAPSPAESEVTEEAHVVESACGNALTVR